MGGRLTLDLVLGTTSWMEEVVATRAGGLLHLLEGHRREDEHERHPRKSGGYGVLEQCTFPRLYTSAIVNILTSITLTTFPLKTGI